MSATGRPNSYTEMIITVVTTETTPAGGIYPTTEVYRLEFESEIKAKADLHYLMSEAQANNGAIAAEQLMGTREL